MIKPNCCSCDVTPCSELGSVEACAFSRRLLGVGHETSSSGGHCVQLRFNTVMATPRRELHSAPGPTPACRSIMTAPWSGLCRGTSQRHVAAGPWAENMRPQHYAARAECCAAVGALKVGGAMQTVPPLRVNPEDALFHLYLHFPDSWPIWQPHSLPPSPCNHVAPCSSQVYAWRPRNRALG